MKKLLLFLFFIPVLAYAHNVADNIKIVPLKKMAFPAPLFVETDNDYPTPPIQLNEDGLRYDIMTSLPE